MSNKKRMINYCDNNSEDSDFEIPPLKISKKKVVTKRQDSSSDTDPSYLNVNDFDIELPNKTLKTNNSKAKEKPISSDKKQKKQSKKNTCTPAPAKLTETSSKSSNMPNLNDTDAIISVVSHITDRSEPPKVADLQHLSKAPLIHHSSSLSNDSSGINKSSSDTEPSCYPGNDCDIDVTMAISPVSKPRATDKPIAIDKNSKKPIKKNTSDTASLAENRNRQSTDTRLSDARQVVPTRSERPPSTIAKAELQDLSNAPLVRRTSPSMRSPMGTGKFVTSNLRIGLSRKQRITTPLHSRGSL